MYRIFYMLLLFPITLFSQTDSTFETSRLEKMMMQPGGLIRMETDAIGGAGNVQIGAISVNDINNMERRTAICFVSGGWNNPVFSSSNLHIDGEEVDELIIALEKFREAMSEKKSDKPQTFQFTASNLVLVTFENRLYNPEKWDISICRRYKYLNAKEANSCLVIRGRDLDDFIHSARRFITWQKDSK
jgi:hypothetical protein